MSRDPNPARSLASLSLSQESSTASAIPRPAARWRTRVLLPVAVLLSFALLLTYAARNVLIPATDVYVIPVIAKAASNEDVDAQPGELRHTPSILVQAPGWIEPDPYATTVPALVEGVVKEVLVLEGEQVEAGQIVARLLDEDLQIAARSARAAVAEAEATVTRMQAKVGSAQAGVLVESAAADALRDEVVRKKELVSAGTVGRAEIRRLELQLQGLDARVAQAKSNVIEAEAEVRQMEAALESARANLADAELQLQRAEIRSPSSGTVLTRLVEPGSRISMARGGEGSGMAGGVLRIYDPSKLQVRVDVPLADAAKIGVGTSAEVTSEVLSNETFIGAVKLIVHEANIQRNTVQFKVAISNPSPFLKPEMLCRVRFRGSQPGDSGSSGSEGTHAGGLQLILPTHVLMNRHDQKAQVWLAERAGGASEANSLLREVSLGEQTEDDIIVLSGLQPGDRVIVDPPSTLKPGSRVRVVGEALDSAGADEGSAP